ncbi:MAG: redoxin domain-containing protein [Anaerolineae bacterium]|nr:redoxin domain-containing protein [Anaerolineae bacterium]
MALTSATQPDTMPWRTAFVVALVVGLAWVWVSRVPEGVSGSQSIPPAPTVGHPAPDFVLTTPAGEMLRLRDLRGQAVLINFWASWCGPCRSEMPEFQAAYNQRKDQGFTILAVNQGETGATATAFAQRLGLTFPIVLDNRGEASDLYGVRALPTSFFVDREGIVRAVVVGAMNGPLLESNLRRIFP